MKAQALKQEPTHPPMVVGLGGEGMGKGVCVWGWLVGCGARGTGVVGDDDYPRCVYVGVVGGVGARGTGARLPHVHPRYEPDRGRTRHHHRLGNGDVQWY